MTRLGIYFLVWAPIIVPPLCIIISLIQKRKSSTSLNIDNDTYKIPDGKEYENVRRGADRSNESLADKFDTRFTNVFKNPWEDVL